MKTSLKIVIDNSMDATANTLDMQNDVKTAKHHDQAHDGWLSRLEDHLRGKNDMAGLVILQKVRAADSAEDANIYDSGVEYKLVKQRGYVTKITRFAENGIKLIKAARDDRASA